MITKHTAIEEVVDRILNHEAIKYADSIITMNALRMGTRGYTGPSLRDAIVGELTSLVVDAEELGKRNPPLGLLRQWINEERPGKNLVTDEDLRAFINIAVDSYKYARTE